MSAFLFIILILLVAFHVAVVVILLKLAARLIASNVNNEKELIATRALVLELRDVVRRVLEERDDVD